MTAPATAPEILIAEANPWTADLLAQLVLDVRRDAVVTRVADGQAALARCRRKLPDLVIADGELAILDGVELLRQVRRHPRTPALPFILISRHTDARSVRAALPLAPTAYLAKPFNAELLRQRLQGLLQGSGPAPAYPPALLVSDLQQYLDDVREAGQGAPLLGDLRDAVARSLQASEASLGELEQEFARDPQITARLIAAANSAAEHRGAASQTLAQSLHRLGVARSLNLVLGLAIQRNARLQDPRLSELAGHTGQQAQHSAELAFWLAGRLGLDAELCYTAGLLHNIGELALLRCLQDWLDAGGELSSEQIDSALHQRAASYGSALRIRWRLPFGLRELIAAYYGLGNGVFSREALVLNLSAELLALPAGQGPEQAAQCRAASMLRLPTALLGQVPVSLLRRD
ncbi:Histidine kinase [Pseudomonas sp. 8AS]|uniref:HDOD domain-containing protein n=1 Tax=Pseudomonas sp. 8AS TaxID=2653163 RepID=UPI0012F07DA4|nr:HDOD domain-containing protein [Pseudomonas sp. 8AS]VXB11730.1 Histidine kinase [Pseudomonas sp. 8AS]